MKIQKDSTIKLTNYLLFSMVAPFILILVTMLLSLVQKKELITKFIILLFPIILISLLPLLIGVVGGNEIKMIVNHYRDYLIFCFVLIYLTTITQYKIINGAYLVYDSMIKVFLIISIIKLLILLSAFFFGYSSYEIFTYITETLKVAMMTYDTDNPYIFRIGFAYDSIIPFLLYFMFKELNSKIPKKRKVYLAFYIVMLSFSLIISMSRLFWFYALLLFVLVVIFDFKASSKIKIIMFAVPLILFVLFGTNFGAEILDIISSRFGTSADFKNADSDSIRVEQNYWLLHNFYNSPFFGKGFGFYTNDIIRDINNKYIYESQNLSLLMDFGLITFILFYVTLIAYILKYNNNYKTLAFSLLFFILWAVSGSFNPFLLGTAGAIVLYFSVNYSKLNSMFSK